MDAEWNQFGSSWSDQCGSGSNNGRTVDTDVVTGTAGATYYIETGENTSKLINPYTGAVGGTETFKRVVIFDENMNQISAEETHPDGRTIKLVTDK